MVVNDNRASSNSGQKRLKLQGFKELANEMSLWSYVIILGDITTITEEKTTKQRKLTEIKWNVTTCGQKVFFNVY